MVQYLCILGGVTLVCLVGFRLEHWLQERSIKKENRKLSESFDKSARND